MPDYGMTIPTVYVRCRRSPGCRLPDGHPESCPPSTLPVLSVKPAPESHGDFLAKLDAMRLVDLHALRAQLVAEKQVIEAQLSDTTRVLLPNYRTWRISAARAKSMIDRKFAALNVRLKRANTAAAAVSLGSDPDDVDAIFRALLELAWRWKREGVRATPEDLQLLNAGNSYFSRQAPKESR